MRISSPVPHKRARIEIIPLIDIMFFLLASFMMVSLSQAHMKGIRVNLPAAQGPPPSGVKDFVSVKVLEETRCFSITSTSQKTKSSRGFLNSTGEIRTSKSRSAQLRRPCTAMSSESSIKFGRSELQKWGIKSGQPLVPRLLDRLPLPRRHPGLNHPS